MARKEPAQSSVLLDTGDLAGRLKNTSPRTIERWRTNGTGPPFVRVGRRIFYRESAFERWLDQQTRSHTKSSALRDGTDP